MNGLSISTEFSNINLKTNMIMEDLSLDQIANRIVDAVFSENDFSKENIKRIILPILRIWVKTANSPKSEKSYQNLVTTLMANHLISKLAAKEKYRKKYIKPLEKVNTERQFYRNKLIDIVGIEGVNTMDLEIKEIIND